MNAPFDLTKAMAMDAASPESPLVIANVSRRKFLQGASALGGLVLAVGLPKRCAPRTRPSTARTACRTAGSTTRWYSSPSARTASSASSAIARRWARACAPACR